MMVKPMNRHIGLLMAFGVLMFCTPASADIDDALDSMYLATGNEPSIYQSQKRLGIDAGYLRLRAPVNTFNVVNFSPPRFDVGCGGLDLYGGSFSFVNAEQFRQMLRQIGANALGYAFKLALGSICDNCEAKLTDLMNDIAQKTQMQVDSCKWAQGLVTDTATALGFEVEQETTLKDAAAGTFGDTFEAIQNMFDSGGEELSDGEADGADSSNPKVGNYTWNALTITGTGARFAFAAGNINHNELLLNIAGSFIVRAPNSAETDEGDVKEFLAARLSYIEFKEGKDAAIAGTDDAFPMVRCQDQNECVNPQVVPNWSFEGVSTWVETQLQESADHMANPGTAAGDHVAALQDFLGSLPFTVMKHMLVLQGDSAALDAYVKIMREPVARIYASHLALQMAAAIRNAYDDSDSPDMPENVLENLKQFELDAKEDRRKASEGFAKDWMEAEEFVASRRRHFGDPGFGVKASSN